MYKIVVNGADGKMGKMLIKAITEDDTLRVGGAIERKDSPAIGRDSGLNAGLTENKVLINDNIEKVINECDGVIDFSSPSITKYNVDICLKYKKALVIGTTGLSDDVINYIKDAGKDIPIIWAPNYSVGVTLITKLSKLVAEVLDKGFDVEILEVHHNQKKDAPSGTAIKLLNAVKEVYKTNDIIYGREGITGQRPEKQIGVHAIRGGDVVGEHTVLFLGQGERIEITHKASSRETFAKGAVRAMKYILAKGKGFYTMEDVLGLK